jgi:uncharacterized delta-60 repeat protein
MKRISEYIFRGKQSRERSDDVNVPILRIKLAILGIGICFCLPEQAGARPGDLDTTFGTNGTGKIVMPFPPSSDEDPSGLVVQHDGKFIVVNHYKVAARFNRGGTLDKTFASQGILNSPGNDSFCTGMILDSSDRLLVIGGKSNNTYPPTFFWMRRFSPDGVPDTSFGSAGEVAIEVGDDAFAEDAVVQPDGKIVVVGFLRNYTNNVIKQYFAIIRCTSTGVLDPTFGTGGKVITDLGTYWDESKAVALQPDGKIVVAGYWGYQPQNAAFAVVRYTTNGTLDSAFNGTGKAFFPVGPGSLATAVALQPDGKIPVGGYTYFQYGYWDSAMALARFNTDGTVDTSFGVNGQVTHHEGLFAGWYRILVQPDGKIVACGNRGDFPELYVGRYLTNGNPDPSFGSPSNPSRVGIAPISIGTQISVVNHMALLPNGKLLIAGTAHDTNSPYSANIVVARLQNDGVAFPAITCPEPVSIDCGQSTTLSASISDSSGLPLTVVWNVNGQPVQTNSLPGADIATNFVVSLAHAYQVGTNEVGVTVTDSLSNSDSCSTSFAVVDQSPPVISSANVEPSVLWPPNNKMVEVNVSANVTDNCDDSATWKIVDVTSSAPSNGSTPDWLITGDSTLLLRAERSGPTPRTYSIAIQATDSSGNLSEQKILNVVVAAPAGPSSAQKH